MATRSEEFLNELLKDEYLDFPENSNTRKRMWGVIQQYYQQVEAATLIAAFRKWEIADQQRNIILGAILAYDILRASKENPFLKGDAWLSKQLISALIHPKDTEFVNTVTAIFAIALCDPQVKAQFNGLLPSGKLSSHGIRDLRRSYNERPAKMRQYVKDIFACQNLTTFDSVTIAGNVLKYMDQPTTVAKTSPALNPDFVIRASRAAGREDSNGMMQVGSVIFSLGLLLALITVATPLPTFGVPLAIGVGMMFLGGGMMIAGRCKDKGSCISDSHLSPSM